MWVEGSWRIPRFAFGCLVQIGRAPTSHEAFGRTWRWLSRDWWLVFICRLVVRPCAFLLLWLAFFCRRGVGSIACAIQAVCTVHRCGMTLVSRSLWWKHATRLCLSCVGRRSLDAWWSLWTLGPLRWLRLLQVRRPKVRHRVYPLYAISLCVCLPLCRRFHRSRVV